MRGCFPSINASLGFSCFASVSSPLFPGTVAVYVSFLVVQYSCGLVLTLGEWGVGAHSGMVREGGQAP